MSAIEVEPCLDRIRELNDAFRTTFVGGLVCLTQGATALPETQRAHLLRDVREFADFTPDNDPRGEHDFGQVALSELRLFWKIDYYDRACEGGSPNPANPDVTTRVLTVMLASEY